MSDAAEAGDLIVGAINEFYRVESQFDGQIADDVVRSMTKANEETLDVVIAENQAHQSLKTRSQLILAMIRQLANFQDRFGAGIPDSVIEALDTLSALKGKEYGEIILAWVHPWPFKGAFF